MEGLDIIRNETFGLLFSQLSIHIETCIETSIISSPSHSQRFGYCHWSNFQVPKLLFFSKTFLCICDVSSSLPSSNLVCHCLAWSHHCILSMLIKVIVSIFTVPPSFYSISKDKNLTCYLFLSYKTKQNFSDSLQF